MAQVPIWFKLRSMKRFAVEAAARGLAHELRPQAAALRTADDVAVDYEQASDRAGRGGSPARCSPLPTSTT